MTHKQFSSKGGKARAKKLTKEQRRAIASKGGKARHGNDPVERQQPAQPKG